MKDEKLNRKNKKRFYPKNKEQAVKKPQTPKKEDLQDSLKELQAFINSNYHAE